jgi:peptidoglycan hydrolase-like protein with peptidoglycan-binding domain
MNPTSRQHGARRGPSASAALLLLLLAACSATWDGLSRDTSALFGDDEEEKQASTGGERAVKPAPPPSVLEVQRLLDEQGYDPGAVDGIFGDRTARAIRSYQSNNGMPVTGKVSAGLLERLRQSGRETAPAASAEEP